MDWLLTRLGENVRTVLEPACGSGRYIPGFRARGVEVAGVDSSAAMIARAGRRMEALGLAPARIERADMTAFDLGATFDGAFCPINSLGYLLDEEAVRAHLHCVARHLRPGAKYLVQLALTDTGVSVEYARDEGRVWAGERDGVRVRTTWRLISFDAGTGLERQECAFEVLAGPEAGRTFTDEHVQRRWSWKEWAALVAASPFSQRAAWDVDFRPVELDDWLEGEDNPWHELVVRCG